MKLTKPVAHTRFFIYPCKYGTDQSRQGESVISRQCKTADYHCLDPWTAETSGKWRDGRKSPYQATAIKNTEERQKISEAAITKWMLVSEIF